MKSSNSLRHKKKHTANTVRSPSLCCQTQTKAPYNAVTYCAIYNRPWLLDLMSKYSGFSLPDPVVGNWSCKRCSPRCEEPPCLPPIPPSNEDQRKGYQAPQSATSPLHICFDESPLMCWALQAQGIVPPSLISIPQRTQSTKPHGLSLTGNALTQTGNTSVFDHVIFWEAGSRIVCAIMITCCNLSWSLLNTQLLQWGWLEAFWTGVCGCDWQQGFQG